MQIAGIGTRGSGTCGTGTAVLGQALQGQRDWDMRNWDSFCDSLHVKDVSVKMRNNVTMCKCMHACTSSSLSCRAS